MSLYGMHQNNFPFTLVHCRSSATLIKNWHRKSFKIMKMKTVLLQNMCEKHTHEKASSEVVMSLASVLK
jgi:hypothetical protein